MTAFTPISRFVQASHFLSITIYLVFFYVFFSSYAQNILALRIPFLSSRSPFLSFISLKFPSALFPSPTFQLLTLF